MAAGDRRSRSGAPEVPRQERARLPVQQVLLPGGKRPLPRGKMATKPTRHRTPTPASPAVFDKRVDPPRSQAYPHERAAKLRPFTSAPTRSQARMESPSTIGGICGGFGFFILWQLTFFLLPAVWPTRDEQRPPPQTAFAWRFHRVCATFKESFCGTHGYWKRNFWLGSTTIDDWRRKARRGEDKGCCITRCMAPILIKHARFAQDACRAFVRRACARYLNHYTRVAQRVCSTIIASGSQQADGHHQAPAG